VELFKTVQKCGEVRIFGNLSVPDFSVDELALLPAPNKLDLFRE